jgi:hypothetical protein
MATIALNAIDQVTLAIFFLKGTTLAFNVKAQYNLGT